MVLILSMQLTQGAASSAQYGIARTRRVRRAPALHDHNMRLNRGAPMHILWTALGIAGSIIATYVGQAMGWHQAGQSAGLVGALLGAVVLLVIYHLIVRTRQ
jgi:uncharacterized membrane protein YeaQ/YmgE (transglycosylase-associated protein family)